MIRNLLTAVLMAALVSLSACGDDEDVQDAVLQATLLLSKTWEVGYVAIDGQDVTDLGYLLMQLTFTADGGWSATDTNGLFATSGTWAFPDSPSGKDLTRIVMSSTTMGFEMNSEGSFLTLTFDRSSPGAIGGRSNQIEGSYELFLLPKFVP